MCDKERFRLIYKLKTNFNIAKKKEERITACPHIIQKIQYIVHYGIP